MGNIKKVCEEIAVFSLEKLELNSDAALRMVMTTGQTESGYDYLRQIKGPAIGFWQMEPATMWDIWENYVLYRPKYKEALWRLGFNEGFGEQSLLSNLAVQAAFCRIVYLRDPYPIPSLNDLEEQARCCKRAYNTKLGKGTIEHFMEANEDGFC